MGDLVPHGGKPVPLLNRFRRRPVHDHHVAEGGAEDADPRQAGRTHGEIIVMLIELENHRSLETVAVSRRHLLTGPLDKLADVNGQHGAFVGMGPQDERIGGVGVVAVEGVEETQRVDGLRVEGIALIGGLEVAVPGFHLVQTEQVGAQGEVGVPVVRVDLDGFLEQCHGFPVPPGNDVEVRGHRMDVAEARIDLQRLSDPGARQLRGGDAAQMIGGREQCHGVELLRDRRGRTGDQIEQNAGCTVAVAVLEQQARPQHANPGVHGIERQGPGDGTLCRARETIHEQLRPAGQGGQVVRVERKRLLEQRLGIGGLMGREKQHAPAGAQLRVIRVLGYRPAEGLVGPADLVEPPVDLCTLSVSDGPAQKLEITVPRVLMAPV